MRVAAPRRAGLVQGLLQELALSSQEGVALMCLVEALQIGGRAQIALNE